MSAEQLSAQAEQEIQMYTQPIPEVVEPKGWKDVPIRETEKSKEELVPLGMFSASRQILTSSVYDNEHENSPYEKGIEGSLTTQFVRSGVAERLQHARTFLPRGYHIMAMDTYRPLEVQGALYKQYYEPLAEMHPDWTEEQLATETQRYVSLPSSDPTKPSPHNTGGAVDVVLVKLDDESQAELEKIDQELDSLPSEQWEREYLLEMERSALIREKAQMLNFGTDFDHAATEKGWLRYYETLEQERNLTAEELEAQASRRLLYHAMISAGFEPYHDEWWHYNDPATQMGAKTAGREFAEYNGASMSEANWKHEEMRKLHRINTERLATGIRWQPPAGLERHYVVALTAARGNNPRDLSEDSGLSVEKISPVE